jgi:hypothetical protein
MKCFREIPFEEAEEVVEEGSRVVDSETKAGEVYRVENEKLRL